jgi:predicted nucleotidyltransferase
VSPAPSAPPPAQKLAGETGAGHGSGDDELTAVLRDTVAALDAAGIPHLVMGGVGSAAMGRPRGTQDIDVFVHPDAARPALEALASAGFSTEETDPRWLYKGFKDGVLVDVIFRSSGEIYLDEEMLARSSIAEFKGCPARFMAPEDLLVIKAIAAQEHVPHHWYDALAIIGSSDLDWDYLVSRARRHGVKRILSLLLYAQSNDLGVPSRAVRRLTEAIDDG